MEELGSYLCAFILEVIHMLPDTESVQVLQNPRFQKLVLLSSIKEQLTANTISENTLEQLEIIEKIDQLQGVAITESMKKAYSYMMLDCTVQACHKFCRRKSACMEKSIFQQLVFQNFGVRTEVAGPPLVCDPAKTRNCALEALTEYLAEAYPTAPSLLEILGNDDEELEFAEHGPRQEAEQAPLTFDTLNPGNSTDLQSNANEPIGSTDDQVGKDPLITNGDTEIAGHELSDSPKAQENCISNQKPCKRPSHVIEMNETESCCSSEVRKARKALKVNCQELKAVVTDPLKAIINKHISELDKGVAAKPSARDDGASQCEGQDQVNQPSLNNNHIAECVNANGENDQTLEDDPGAKPCSKLRMLPRRLMERNVTDGESRRRRKKYWSVEEEDALREAVNKYGEGKWKSMLQSNPGVFKGRTGADLKDKWRNMLN